MENKNIILLLIIALIAMSGCIENDEGDTTTISNDGQDIDNFSNDNLDPLGYNIETVSNICVECHSKPVKMIKESGGLHSQKSCNFCHVQHGYVPKCSDCHGSFHGNTITNCAQCHTDAHAPKDITFSSEADKFSCNICHISEVTTFNINPTKHSNLECTHCHTKHGLIPECTNCHTLHDDAMTADDCGECHTTGHVPTKVIYLITTPKSLCSGCHADAISVMDNSNTKHSELLCSQCHPKHAQIPACSSCHGIPHGPTVTDCGIRCHLSGHDVWKKIEL
ncbi:MAG: hypothetical protein K0A90_02830 [Methanosarcinaceae archaeon]|nr:hypothetical protein [Methanosarcinaceae archaeon]